MDPKFKPIGTLIHGIAASEHLDSSGERISIRGLDVSSLERDGIFNHEHKNEVPDQIVGKILKAKKIFSEEDCETPEELYFWHKSQAPYVYVMGELFDGVGHKGAQEIAAMLKYDHIARQQNRSGLNVVNFSIEGSKLSKEGQEITRALARKVTITTAACNKVAVAELYDPAKFSKKESILDFTKSENLGVGMSKENVRELKLPTAQNVAKPNKNLSSTMSSYNGVKKTITADSGLTAPSAKMGGAALVPESIEKDIKKLPNFEKFLKFIQSKYPNMSKNEAEAMAKYFTARAMIKAEEALEKMAQQDLDKSKNVREQRRKIFGTDANAPRLSDKRIKMMQQIRNFAQKKFGMPMEIAEGKRDNSGKLREDKDNQPAYNIFSPEGVRKEKKLLEQYKKKGIKRTDPKPDWRSGRLETQPSPDAAVHELAHLYLAPEGMNPAAFQEHMDELWGESQKKYGHMQQKKTYGEIQPMSVENPIRRELGLPANRATKPVKQNEKALDYEGYRFVEGKDSTGKKVFYDRQSRLMTPETRERVEQIREGSLKFHPSVGWFKDNSPDSLINLRGRGKVEEAKARAQQRYSQQLAPKKLAASEMDKIKHLTRFGQMNKAELEIQPEEKEENKQTSMNIVSTAHPHSFYYIAGTEPEHIAASGASAKCVIEIPEEARIYDISHDPMGYEKQVRELNNGILDIDMMHELIKQGGYHGFIASNHPNEDMRNIVGIYHHDY